MAKKTAKKTAKKQVTKKAIAHKEPEKQKAYVVQVVDEMMSPDPKLNGKKITKFLTCRNRAFVFVKGIDRAIRFFDKLSAQRLANLGGRADAVVRLRVVS